MKPDSLPMPGRTGLFCAILAALALAFAGAFFVALSPRPARAAASGAFTAPDNASVPGLVASLRGCLSNLPAADQRTLTLRAGLDGHAPRLSTAVAAALGVSPSAATAAEITAIRKLEAQRRHGACQARPAASTSGHAPAAAASTPPAGASTPASASATPTPTPTANSASTSTPATAAAAPATSAPVTATASTGVLGVLLPGLLVLAFVGGISLELHRRPAV